MPVVSSKKEKKRKKKTKTLGDSVRLDPEPVAEPVPDTFQEPFEVGYCSCLPFDGFWSRCESTKLLANEVTRR
jgi:hypothetical protein